MRDRALKLSPDRTEHDLGYHWSIAPWLMMLLLWNLLTWLTAFKSVWIPIKEQVWGSKDRRNPDVWSVTKGQRIFDSKHHTRLKYYVATSLHRPTTVGSYRKTSSSKRIACAHFLFYICVSLIVVLSTSFALKLRSTQTWIWIDMRVALMLNATAKHGGVRDCFHSVHGALRTFLTSYICGGKRGPSIKYFPISRECSSTRKRWCRVRCFVQWLHFINQGIHAHRLRHAATMLTSNRILGKTGWHQI